MLLLLLDVYNKKMIGNFSEDYLKHLRNMMIKMSHLEHLEILIFCMQHNTWKNIFKKIINSEVSFNVSGIFSYERIYK